MDERERVIRQQQDSIRELSTPAGGADPAAVGNTGSVPRSNPTKSGPYGFRGLPLSRFHLPAEARHPAATLSSNARCLVMWACRSLSAWWITVAHDSRAAPITRLTVPGTVLRLVRNPESIPTGLAEQDPGGAIEISHLRCAEGSAPPGRRSRRSASPGWLGAWRQRSTPGWPAGSSAGKRPSSSVPRAQPPTRPSAQRARSGSPRRPARTRCQRPLPARPSPGRARPFVRWPPAGPPGSCWAGTTCSPACAA